MLRSIVTFRGLIGANLLCPKIEPISITARRAYRASFDPVMVDLSQFPEHRALVVEEFGDPNTNVILKTDRPENILPKQLEPQEVIVKHLAAPINPADINIIQGVYGIRPKLPVIIGNEGVVRIEVVGNGVKILTPGDYAVPIIYAKNWQNYSVNHISEYVKISNLLDLSTAAQLKVNPSTAYRMLKDFYKLEKGDTVIQNGANSAVGVYVIQLAKHWGYNTINVIRDRPNKDEIVQELKEYGANVVLTEAEVGDIQFMKPILEEFGKPKLFFNCVGGKNAVNCQRHLELGGTSITYGAMSKQPFSVTASSLIFKEHNYVGFWVSNWFKRNTHLRPEITDMITEISDMFIEGILKPKASRMISFEERNLAFSGESSNIKFIFDINQ